MNQLENLFNNKLLEIGVRNCLACNTNFDDYNTCEAIFNLQFVETVIEELLLESKITLSQSNILHNWLNYGEWI